MYEPDRTEQLYLIKDANGIHRITMDLESYAHCMNNPEIEVLEEIMTIHRAENEEGVFYPLIPGGEVHG